MTTKIVTDEQLLIEGKEVSSVGVGNRYSKQISDWRNFYQELGISADFTNLQIPKKLKGFDRLIIIPKGLTIEVMYNKCQEHFTCWKCPEISPSYCWKCTNMSLDEAVPFNDRSSNNGSYAIWVRDRVEADEELKNLSANQLRRMNIQGVTLLERLVYELKYFKETGKHLDIDNITLCSGSCCSDGGVPSVGWHSDCDRLRVGWFFPGYTHDGLRSRSVVSL